jgi:hypothetical protein
LNDIGDEREIVEEEEDLPVCFGGDHTAQCFKVDPEFETVV